MFAKAQKDKKSHIADFQKGEIKISKYEEG